MRFKWSERKTDTAYLGAPSATDYKHALSASG
nr:MAG TPA: hypothetical protein [Caudoviricetes sp.]